MCIQCIHILMLKTKMEPAKYPWKRKIIFQTWTFKGSILVSWVVHTPERSFHWVHFGFTPSHHPPDSITHQPGVLFGTMELIANASFWSDESAPGPIPWDNFLKFWGLGRDTSNITQKKNLQKKHHNWPAVHPVSGSFHGFSNLQRPKFPTI